MIDEYVTTVARALAVGGYAPFDVTEGTAAAPWVKRLTDAGQAPLFTRLVVSIGSLGTPASALEALLREDNEHEPPLFTLLCSAVREEGGMDAAAAWREIRTACRTAHALLSCDGVASDGTIGGNLTAYVLTKLRLCGPDASRLAAPVFRCLVSMLANGHKLAVGVPWSADDIAATSDGQDISRRAIRPLCQLLDLFAAHAAATSRGEPRTDWGDACTYLVRLLLWPDLRAIQKGDAPFAQSLRDAVDQNLQVAFRQIQRTRRRPYTDATREDYVRRFLDGLFWPALAVAFGPSVRAPRAPGTGPDPQAPLDPDDSLPDDDLYTDPDAMHADHDDVDEDTRDETLDEGSAAGGERDLTDPTRRVGRLLPDYSAARRSMLALPQPDHIGVIPVQDIARIYHHLATDETLMPLQRRGIELFVHLALHTGLDADRLLNLTVASDSSRQDFTLRPGGPAVYVPQAVPLLAYKSEMDADLRHGPASTRWHGWPYVRTDDVRRIPLPISLADEMAAYDRDVGAPHDHARPFLVKEGEEGSVVPITRGEIERIIATATAASPSPATLRRFPATFRALHVAAGLDDYIAWLVCDRFGSAHRTRAYYTCISALTVGRALGTAAREVRERVRAVAEVLGLRPPPALDGPRVHPKDRARGAAPRRVVLPSIGSPFRLRDDAIRALVTYLYARLASVHFAETLRTPEGHNLATVYLVLCLALLTALRPFEVDDLMADLCFVESDDKDIGSLIPCPLIVAEAKANRHHEEDRLIPLFGVARHLVEQALSLPSRAVAETLPAPLRGRLFYLIESDGFGQLTARLPTASALMEVLKRTLQDDNLVHLVEELRLYDMRHVLRSQLMERLCDLRRAWAFAGDQTHVIDLIMGHHEDGGWLDPLVWPRSVGDGWLGDANRMAADRLYDDLATSWRIKPLPPLGRANPRGRTIRRTLSTTERMGRLTGDRADLRTWLTGVTRDIDQGRGNAFADLSVATRKRIATRLVEEGARLVVPYLTPRGIDALATRVIHDTVRGLPRRLHAGTALAGALSRACGLPLPTTQAMAGGGRPRTTDAVRLAVLRDYPLWAVDALRRAIGTTFPTSLLPTGAGPDRTAAGYALALLLLVEGCVLPAAGLRAIASPDTVVTLCKDELLVRPQGHGAALPPWRVPAATLAYTVAAGLVVRGQTQRTLPLAPGTIRLLPEGTSAAGFDAWLHAVCTRANVPPIPAATLTEWCRVAALWVTPALSLDALAGSSLYATSIPDSSVVRDAWRHVYPDDEISASGRVMSKQPSPGPVRQRPPSAAYVMEVSPALQTIRDSLRHLRNDLSDRVTIAEECLARVAAQLGVPPPSSRDTDAWGTDAVTALQGASLGDVERNALILDLWLGVQAARRTRRALAKGTLVRYGYTLVRFVNSLGAIPLREATTLDVVDFLDRGDATRTRQTNFGAVCALLDLSGLMGCPAIDRTNEELHLAIQRWPMPVLLPQQVERFLASDSPLRDKAMGIVGLMGLRSGEVRRLSLGDIELGGDAYIVVWRSKRGTTRRVPLRVFPPHWRVILTQFVEEQRQVGGDYDAPLFATTTGGRYNRSEHMTKTIVARLTEISGFALRFHDLRGSCANYLLSRRYDARFIALILGHATVLSTLWYAHILDQDTPPVRPLQALHPYVSATEVATLTGLPPHTIRSLLKEVDADVWSPGQIHKAITQAGGHVPLAPRGRPAERFRTEDVSALLYRLYIAPVATP